MTANESWVNQGRQSHGYFGNGTSPTNGNDPLSGANELFRPVNAAQRVDYVATSIVMHAPRNERSRWEPAVSDTARDRLKTAVAAWYGASALSRDAFRSQFLDPYTSDETVDRLRSAARGMVEGQSYDDLAKAGADLATAAQQIGVDRWPRFIGDAAQHASLVVSNNAVPGVIKASATGTDAPLAGAIFLGGLSLYLAWKNGWQEPSPTIPTPSLPPVVESKPPQDAKDADGAKAPGKPGTAEGFQDPKGGENWVPNPNGRGYGWQDAKGDVWVPSGPGRPHGGPHWDVQSPGGRHRNISPGGNERPGR